MLQFFLQFLKNPRSIGAVAPSGKFLARKMMEPIDFERTKCIVEFGPGTGAFTREIMKRKGKDTKLILIEQNQIFCNRLKERYKNQRGVYAVCDSAEGMLFIIPIFQDFIICIGASLMKINLPLFLLIAIISKTISIGMIEYSGLIGDVFQVNKWQIIIIELFIINIISYLFKIHKRSKEKVR